MHGLNGNGGSKAKGKGRGKFPGKPNASNEQQPVEAAPLVPTDLHADIRQQVQMALPDAARLRTQTTLIDSEWSVAVLPWQS